MCLHAYHLVEPHLDIGAANAGAKIRLVLLDSAPLTSTLKSKVQENEKSQLLTALPSQEETLDEQAEATLMINIKTRKYSHCQNEAKLKGSPGYPV